MTVLRGWARFVPRSPALRLGLGLGTAASAAALAVAGWVLAPVLSSSERLAVRWEGAVIDRNFRDIGASMNQCLGDARYAEGLAFRAAGWFSGWRCAGVGNPEEIYSLDYDPKLDERFFCRGDDGLVIGKVRNPTMKLSDLEFVATWNDPEVARNACGFFEDSFRAISSGHRTLIHCDAGRDRTGTYAALLSALVAEEHGELDDRMLGALECDYRKSRSLKPAKYGRISTFIKALMASGGVAAFFERTCHISPALLLAVSDRMAQAPRAAGAPAGTPVSANH